MTSNSNSELVIQLTDQINQVIQRQEHTTQRLLELLEVFVRQNLQDQGDGEDTVITVKNERWMEIARNGRLFVRQTEEGWKLGLKKDDGWYPGVTAAEWNPQGLYLNPATAMAEDGYPVEEGGS